MADRPVFHPELGTFFRRLREAKGWNQSQAASQARRWKLNALTRQVLIRLETGKTKNPEPDVLLALARLYEWPPRELFARFLEARYGITVKPEALDLGAALAPVVGDYALLSSEESETLMTLRLLPRAKTEHVLAIIRDMVAASQATVPARRKGKSTSAATA